jgi:branched-chain amino acid transport system permease protein
VSEAAIVAHGAAGRRTWNRGAMVALVGLLLVLPHIPGLASDFARSLLTQMGIAAVFALSFNVLFGQTGLLSFGHAVYFGMGGYAAIHAMRAINHGFPLPMVLVPLAGAAGGLACGLVLGALTTRRAGTIFALISLGVGELFYAAAFMLPRFFGGEEGISASRTRGSFDLGIPLATQLDVYYVVVAWGLVAAALMYAFQSTPVGRMCNAVRDNPQRAQFVGYSTTRVRFIAFAVAAMFAGLAGGLHAINYEIVAADALGAQRSGTVLIMAYIGGCAYFAGPVLGAIAITWLSSSLSSYTPAWQLYLGVFFIVMILYAPEGSAGLLLRHRAATRPSRGGWARAAAASVPLLLIAAGAIVIVEMGYRLSTQAELGTRMRVLWIGLDAASAWPWVLATIAFAVGAIALPRVLRSSSGAPGEAS